MTEKFLKARIPAALYEQLQADAGIAGKRLGTHVRELLEQHAKALSTSEALVRIEAAIGASASAPAALQAPALDHEARQLLHEVRLIARELAMATNAQIVARVASQLKSQFPQNL